MNPRPAFLLLSALVAFCPRTSLPAEEEELQRRWTSTDGRTVEMKLRKLRGDTGVFLVGDRRVELPLSRLSREDVAIAEAWWGALPRPLEWPEMVEVETRTLEAAELPEAGRPGWWVYQTRHFEFHSQAKLATSLVKDIARVFEATLKLVDSLPWGIRPTPPEGSYYRAELYLSRASYQAAGGPSNSGGVYLPSEKKFMVPFESLGVKRVGASFRRAEHYEVDTLVHEITHQAMHFWLRYLPKWLIEGSAEFTEVTPYHYGKFRVDRIQTGLKDHFDEFYRHGAAGLYPVGPLLTMNHREWAAVSTSYAAQKSLYGSSLLLTYYFMHLDGEGDGKRMRSFLAAVGKLKTDWEAFQKDYQRYQKEFQEFLTKPGVVDHGNGSFTFPSSLTPPKKPTLPLPEEEMERAAHVHLNLLLEGRTPAEIEADLRAEFKKIGVKVQ